MKNRKEETLFFNLCILKLQPSIQPKLEISMVESKYSYVEKRTQNYKNLFTEFYSST